MNMVGWFEIYVNDLEKAKAFYQTVLAKELSQLPAFSDNMPEMWAFPWTDGEMGAPGAICKMQGVDAGGNSTMVYFNCKDCAEEESRIEGAGGKVVCSKMQIGEFGFIVVASDPDGNMIGFHSEQ
ncbi:VOC family protein [Thaumasiovibrio subtropicus]|uniref:VOC family protein n=1 Tax=Thaumasiovibrio subtropicus TaxID=1891207 RepID=UPI000B35B412|nr:VOC family protein [Thaumasiovibrio subtropicus]